jgi:hypothetical protein
MRYSLRISIEKKEKRLNQQLQRKFDEYSTAQHSTAQHSTAQHSTAQHITAQHTYIPSIGLVVSEWILRL